METIRRPVFVTVLGKGHISGAEKNLASSKLFCIIQNDRYATVAHWSKVTEHIPSRASPDTSTLDVSILVVD